jgi:hypothetical protein
MKDLNHLTRTAGCIALIAVLAACAKKEEASPPNAAPVAADMAEAPAASGVVAEMRRGIAAPAPAAPPPPPMAELIVPVKPQMTVTTATPAQQMASSAATYVDGQRKFIRTANARFLVKDVYVAALGVEDTVASHGGFVVKNDISAATTTTQTHPIGDGKLLELSEYNVQGQLTVRVPSAKTQEFLRAIAGHIVFLDQRSFSAHDAQFDMLRQQLEVVRNHETQGELGDVVQDGGRLSHRTEAINTRNEVKAARDEAFVAKKEAEDQVAFSTIELTLYQPSKVLRSEKVDVAGIYREYRQGFLSRMGEKLQSGWDGLQNFVLWLTGIWPALVIAGALGALVWRARKWRGKSVAAD